MTNRLQKYIPAWRPLLLLCVTFWQYNPVKAQQDLSVLSEVLLMADGSEGTETYALIQSVFGNGCIEAPDLYPLNHPGVKHIVEKTDDIVGNYFEFLIHRDIDKDRDTDYTDRQRNEIKTYDPSPANVKGFRDETMRFHWYFRLQDGFTISKNFSHFFQLKAVNGDDSQPIATISGSINSGNYEFEIIHNSGNSSSDVQLTHTDWTKANNGEWMEMEVIATFADEGYLKITVSTLGGEEIMSVEKSPVDMWRTGSTFVRPKWGIYRSLSSKSYLSPDEESADFALFTVQKLGEKETTSTAASDLPGHRLFPNPAKDYLRLDFTSPESGELKVINSTGRTFLIRNIENTYGLDLQLSEWPAGIYLLMMDDRYLDRFIKL